MPDEIVFEIPRTCVVTIQGGGALAVELIGQLKGVTGYRKSKHQATGDHEMDVVGLAGASAGSIIAALFWAGYEPDEILRLLQDIFSPQGRETFFGPYEPGKISSYAAVDRFQERAGRILFGRWSPRNWPSLLPRMRRWLARAELATFIFFRNSWAFRKQGILQAEGFVSKIDALLRSSPKLKGKLPPHVPTEQSPNPPPLTFGDLRGQPELRLVPLFLMVTDVAGQKLKIVSSIDQQDQSTEIARAVRASAGFPVFFQPTALPGAPICIDGGVISNLPTWVFDAEFRERLRSSSSPNQAEADLLHRIARLPWHHVALRLPPDAPSAPPQGGGPFFLALWKLLSGVGRQQLEGTLSGMVGTKRFMVRRSLPAAQPGNAPATAQNEPQMISGVLAFGELADTARVNHTFRIGRECAQAAIRESCFEVPAAKLFLPVLRDLAGQAQAALAPFLAPGGLVRTNLFLPATSDQLRIYAAVNMEGHVDEAIRIEEGQAVTSLSFIYGEPFLANLQDGRITPQPAAKFQPFAARARSSQSWLLSVPVLDPLDARPRMYDEETGSSLVLQSVGPIFGVVNVDASILYGAHGLDPDPLEQSTHSAVRAVFSATQVAARQIGMLMNSAWLTQEATS